MPTHEDRYEAEVLRWAADILRKRTSFSMLRTLTLGVLYSTADRIWKRPPMEKGEPMYKVWEREEATRLDAQGKESRDR